MRREGRLPLFIVIAAALGAGAAAAGVSTLLMKRVVHTEPPKPQKGGNRAHHFPVSAR